jgi:aminopeptidase-like protein
LKHEIEKYFDRLWPINRSLTGNGNRETLKILSELVDMKIREIPSGTQCFDWTVPPEWNVREAWVKDSSGKKIIDFSENNLHLLGYSQGYEGKLTLDELKDHLHSSPEQPEVIPYRTSYYSPRWGFCLSHLQLQSLKEDLYEVKIDAEHNPTGFMTVGEAIIPGETEREILISTYICHPSMASNELSGPLVSSFLYNKLKSGINRYHTLRFLFVPETIGAIWYLSVNGNRLMKELKAGFVLTCIGDDGAFTYKKSRRGNSVADRCAEYVFDNSNAKFTVEDFFPTGSDERQYCSPGFNLPVGSIMRTRYGKYDEYHTSADNKSYISFEAMEESVNMCAEIIDVIDKNAVYNNLMPFCEPQLGKRGLYPTMGSMKDTSQFVNALMWVLNQSDSSKDLLEMSRLSNINFSDIVDASDSLSKSGLIERIS